MRPSPVAGRGKEDTPHMLIVTLREGETGEQLLNRFNKMVQKDGILREAKARRHFISVGEQRRIAERKAEARRRRKARRASRAAG
jgi:ribosomal protein S21